MAELADFVRWNNVPQITSFVPTSHNDTYPFITPTGSELTGKTVVITGASKGIGLATAIRLVKAGCSRIAIAARSSLDEAVKELKSEAQRSNLSPPIILPLTVDVTSDEAVRAAAHSVEEVFGKIDILINNAGYMPKFQRMGETDPLEWWQGFEVNVKGTFLCANYFFPLLLRSQTKIMVNLTSVGAHTLTLGGSSYMVSRFANCRVNEFLARDYEEEGLVAISLHPGGVATDMRANFPERLHAGLQDDVNLSADTIVWLVKERREWLNGRYVSGPWDMEELEARKKEILERDLLKFRMTIR
ncbi:hypothetical protein N7466_010100 [Penicillium verhagenii]|uniref:uncharacterized protein n=1 Tax=Penicillium verhagenii TaxID=1562060 RepID=UPI0025459DB2|nr:uncharacterized protein N7466_010100 [Penicillium verhagenii]KAJ5919157.1 hypothetical protein N7466_010100 [Penicillium verhagenii]